MRFASRGHCPARCVDRVRVVRKASDQPQKRPSRWTWRGQQGILFGASLAVKCLPGQRTSGTFTNGRSGFMPARPVAASRPAATSYQALFEKHFLFHMLPHLLNVSSSVSPNNYFGERLFEIEMPLFLSFYRNLFGLGTGSSAVYRIRPLTH